jgi:hypothetical protein
MLKLLLSLVCACAFAAESTVTYHASAQGEGEWSALMRIPQFNPALGTLKDATISYWYERGASMALNSLEPEPINFYVSTLIGYSLRSPIAVPIEGALGWTFYAPLETYGGFETNYVAVGQWSKTFSGYIGTGTIDFNAAGWEDFSYAFPQDVEVLFCSWSAWRLTMVYRYEEN